MQYVDLIFFAFAVIVVFGGFVMNLLKKAREAAEAHRQKREQTFQHLQGSSPESNERTMTPKERLDALAAKRRDEFQQLKTQMRGDVSGNVAGQPDNLTAAQRAARDRARAAYQKRAELLARQRQAQQQAAQNKASNQASRQQTKQGAKPPSAQRSSAAQSHSAQRQQAAMQRNPASGRAASQSQPQRMAPPLSQQQRDVASAAATAARGMTPVAEMMVDTFNPADAIPPSTDAFATRPEVETRGSSPMASSLKKALTGKSVRAAFVLKEVLEKPVALRNPESLPGQVMY